MLLQDPPGRIGHDLQRRALVLTVVLGQITLFQPRDRSPRLGSGKRGVAEAPDRRAEHVQRPFAPGQ